jgi:Flp pilus assembly protein, ATPase CpaF
MNTMTRSQQSEAYRQSDGYQTLKHRLHRFLILQIEEQNLEIGSWSAERIDRFIGEQLRRFVGEERVPVNQTEAELLVGDVRDELVGYGPIQALVDDDGIDDIVVNGPNKIFIERAGRLYLMPIRFADDNHVIRVIQRILAPLGRRVDESTPMVDARLPDGSRVNAVIPPIALDGPACRSASSASIR